MINREDMLELTRRMTVKRTSFTRVAGAYMDKEGFVDDTFNTSFPNLADEEKSRILEIAKTIPFADTNQKLKKYKMTGKMNQLLWAIKENGLLEDVLLLNLYELLGEHFLSKEDYAIYFFHDRYDIPCKAGDKQRLGESENVFTYIICAIAPLKGDYEPGIPQAGFLFPSFCDAGAEIEYINIFGETIEKQEMLASILGVV